MLDALKAAEVTAEGDGTVTLSLNGHNAIKGCRLSAFVNFLSMRVDIILCKEY